MVFKNINMWLHTAHPRPRILFFAILIKIIESITLISLAIPAAQIITSIGIADYSSAIINVKIEVVLAITYSLLSIINSFILANLSSQIIKASENLLIKHFFENVIEFDKTSSKQNIINIFTYSSRIIGNFAYQFVQIFGNIGQIIFIISLIFYNNLTLGVTIILVLLALLVLCLILTFFEKLFTRKISFYENEKIKQSADIVNGLSLIQSLGLDYQINTTSLNNNKSLTKQINRESILKNINQKLIFLFSSFALAFITIYLIHLLRLDFLTQTLFIITIPYLSQCLNLTLNSLEISSTTNKIKEECDKINSILSITSHKIMSDGQNKTDKLSGNLMFSNVCLTEKKNALINNFTAYFDKKMPNLLLFNNLNSSLMFLKLLKRELKPTKGTITLDGINIYEFSKDIFPHNISFVEQNPFFFDDTIFNNLKITKSSKRDVLTTIKALKIDEINSLSEGLHTKISLIKQNFTLYLIGIARALLSKAEVLVFEDLPQSISQNQLYKLVCLINKIAKSRTILIVSTSIALTKMFNAIVVK